MSTLSAPSPLLTLDASEAAKRIANGALSSTELVSACLDHIEASDRTLEAWEYVDRELALSQAETLDRLRQKGEPLGALHGVPVGIKDIVDTHDMPTGYGVPFKRGHRPAHDAAVIEKLREAGAVVLGKTVSTEYAFLHPSRTSNPHNPQRTPGGSSSGSAAAVAAKHVPLAIGTQTNGSTIRPASFCGVYGFKPTRGIISRRGVLQTSETLDQIGIFGQTLNDVGLLADVLGGYDRADTLSYARARPAMAAGASSEAPLPPNFAWLEMPFNERLDKATVEGFAELRDCLGDQVDLLPAPALISAAIASQKVIHEYELCRHLADDINIHWDELSDEIKPAIERGRAYQKSQYEDAIATLREGDGYFEKFFYDYDAVIAPATAGEAPTKPSGTGDPIFCTAWTFFGLPALSLPALVGETGLPVGVQLIGSANADDRLLRTASWLLKHLTV